MYKRRGSKVKITFCNFTITHLNIIQIRNTIKKQTFTIVVLQIFKLKYFLNDSLFNMSRLILFYNKY